MYYTVEQLGRGVAGTQKRWKFLEQVLYLGRESGDGGGGLGTPGANKRGGTCLGEGAARGRDAGPDVWLGLLRAQILLENPCLG
jgi:hypothetical protein